MFGAMRVGFDGRSFESPAGGVRRYAAGLLTALVRLEPDLHVVLFAVPGSTLLPPRAERRPVARFAPTNLGWSLVDLPRAARCDRLDLFHAPAYTAPLHSVRPLVLTIHDVSYERHPEWYPYRRDPLRRWFYRRSALAADVIITDSDFSSVEIQVAYGIPSERIRVVPLGVGPPFTSTAPVRVPDALVGDAPYVLHVGDLHPRRNLRWLLHIVARLKATRSLSAGLQLVLAGVDRGERRVLEREAARCGVRLRYVGTPDDNALVQLYTNAAAFVYASRYEGFGLPLLEAMACGAPIVAVRAAAVPEVVGDAGLLIDPDDEEGFSAALASVLEHDEIATQQRAAGLARAATFTWERTARETLSVYHELVS